MPQENPRPVVFIGSSVEGLDVARAIQANLDHDAEVIPWNQGVFGLSEGTLESLVSSFTRFDFAILVLTPDDLVLTRDDDNPSPRDNVVFELGLFMGALGRDRCFIVYDRTATMKLPSDLAGVTAATFQPHKSGTFQSALGAPSTQILTAIRQHGRIDRSPDQVYIDQQSHFGIVADLLEPAAHQFLIAIREHQVSLRREDRFMIGSRYEYFIHSDRHNGRSGNGSFDVNKLCERLADANILAPDLRGRITLTDRGQAFAEWLSASGYKAEYFWSDVATWGDRPSELQQMRHPSSHPQNVFQLQAEQGGADQPATNPESNGAASNEPNPESEVRPH